MLRNRRQATSPTSVSAGPSIGGTTSCHQYLLQDLTIGCEGSRGPGIGAASGWRIPLMDASPQYAGRRTYCQPSLQFANVLFMDDTHTKPHAQTDRESRHDPSVGLGPALRRAWIGYQRRLDIAMADAGFDERRFPDGRVLRLCSDPAGSTISNIGRELGITRQGAGKVVSHLQDRGYVSVADSPTSGREKAVTLTVSGTRYLEAQRNAVRTIESQLRKELGEEPLRAVHRLLDVLDPGDDVRMRTYLSRTTGLSPGDTPK